jgi:GNAT superfamily N-acetyltransferase
MEAQMKKVSTAAEVEMVARMAKLIWKEHYIPIIGEDQVDYMLGKYQSAKAIESQINADGAQYYLILSAEVPVGYVGFTEKFNELFLSKFYLLKQERGKGLGHYAFDFLVARCREIGAAFITLTVNKQNLDTIRVYEKLGFENYGEVITDIGSGYVMDDFLMRLRIKPR